MRASRFLLLGIFCWVMFLGMRQAYADEMHQPAVPVLRQGTPSPCSLVSRLVIGETGRVLPGPANNLRSTSSASGQLLGQIPGSETFTVLEGPVCGENNIVWWRVSYNGVTGWTGEGQDSTYWAEPVVSASPTFSDWHLLVYEMAGNGNLVEVNPAGRTTLPMPGCFSPPMNTAYHNWQQNVLTVSPNRRYAAFTFPASDEVWVSIADSQTGTCFTATVPDVTPNDYPRYHLGAFKSDGTAFVFGFSAATDVSSTGYIGMLVTVDLIDTPGQILNTRSFEDVYPIPAVWDEDGVHFLEAWLCCEYYANEGGQMQVWDPVADTLNESEQRAYFGTSVDQLAYTGEVVGAGYSDDFLQDVIDYGAPGNVLVYQPQPDAASTVVYHNPVDYAVRRAHWVHDGAAVLLQSTEQPMFYDEPTFEEMPARLVYRNGDVKEILLPVRTTFLAGTPDGWLMLLDSSPLRVLHAQYTGDTLIVTDLDISFDAYEVVVLESPLLGETVSPGFTPAAGVERFRQSNCNALPQVSYLMVGGEGQADLPQTLYAEPGTDSEVSGAFDQFTVLNGPVCPDDAYWWLIETDAGIGWASEDLGAMRLFCKYGSSSRWQIGEQRTFEIIDSTDGLYLYPRPFYMAEQLGQINPGDTFEVLDGPVCDSWNFWWMVDFNGLAGWVIEPLILG